MCLRISGIFAMTTHRHAEANNPYIEEFDVDRETNYIMYLDANNVYGWAMSQPLPLGNFGWLSQGEIDNLDVLNIPDDGGEGVHFGSRFRIPKRFA
jgi:hypothetical protein